MNLILTIVILCAAVALVSFALYIREGNPFKMQWLIISVIVSFAITIIMFFAAQQAVYYFL